jgi:hypothetical protein
MSDVLATVLYHYAYVCCSLFGALFHRDLQGRYFAGRQLAVSFFEEERFAGAGVGAGAGAGAGSLALGPTPAEAQQW